MTLYARHVTTFLFIAIFLTTGNAMAAELLTLSDPALYELKSAGLEVGRAGEVRIEAVGMVKPGHGRHWFTGAWSDDDDAMSVYAWVIDSDSRELVWEMRYRDTDRVKGSHSLLEIGETINLPAGRYEVYLFSGHAWATRYIESPREERRWWEKLWSDEAPDPEDLKKELAQCRVTISSETNGMATGFDVTGSIPAALVRANRAGNSEYLSTSFRLDEKTNLRVYGMVERSRGSWGASDYAWIVDAETRERVFDSSDIGLPPAGGNRKNRLIDETVSLKPGEYILYYGTDDSHSFEEFNVNPPFDPYNWGVTILPGSGFDARAFAVIDTPERGKPLVEFTRAGNDEYFEQRFRLEKPTKLSIQALGEGTDESFHDYAWISDFLTRETVWEMEEHNTFAAGGAEKNRMFDGVIELQAGEYVLSYASDGSHSYDEWNAATPFTPDAWGVSIWAGPGTDSRDIALLEEGSAEADRDVLARIVRVGDSERRRERFTITEPTKVFIYALGEGSDGRMYDYGYVVDDESGRTVWEMEYDDTYHAGGSGKNREIRDEIVLQPGTYEVLYVSDGSHSFGGWNASRPRDQMAWGITLHRAEGRNADR